MTDGPAPLVAATGFDRTVGAKLWVFGLRADRGRERIDQGAPVLGNVVEATRLRGFPCAWRHFVDEVSKFRCTLAPFLLTTSLAAWAVRHDS
jgi:hypothetical protein